MKRLCRAERLSTSFGASSSESCKLSVEESAGVGGELPMMRTDGCYETQAETALHELMEGGPWLEILRHQYDDT